METETRDRNRERDRDRARARERDRATERERAREREREKNLRGLVVGHSLLGERGGCHTHIERLHGRERNCPILERS